MTNSQTLNIGLIGLGNIGQTHIANLKKLEQVRLVGVCDGIRERADQYAQECGAQAYYNYIDMFDQSGLDAVIIAVPHYEHPAIAIEAFRRGLHVLCEKPISVHVNDAKRMIEAYKSCKQENPELVFGLMFQERTYPQYKKIKDILEGGELGKLVRVTWINTTMFRSQAYYDSGDWRATWAGEGGGILVNQCPHTLDMYQWLFGVPKRISAHAHIGKYHDIEVEDEVTAYFEHDGGMIGHLIVSTAESPGTNRFEIVGENGKLVYENGKLVFHRNRVSMLKFLQETKRSFGHVENWYTEIPCKVNNPQAHFEVTEAFVQFVLNKQGELIADGSEGLNSVYIANGIMLSSFNGRMVDVPFSGDEYEVKLEELIRTSKYVKKVRTDAVADMSESFGRK